MAVAALLALAACTGDGDDPAPEPKAEASSPAAVEPLVLDPVRKDCTWKLGSMGPLTGEVASLGRGVARAVRLGAAVANADPEIPCKLEVVAGDSKASVERAADVAFELARKRKLVACICGTFSGEVLATGHIFDGAGILLTGPALHQATTRRGFSTWFQAAASNDVNAAMAALYIAEEIAPRNVAFVHDGSSFGRTMTRWVARDLGGAAGTTFRLRPGRDSYAKVAAKVTGDDPDLVYFGGYVPEAVVLVQDLRDAGFEGPFFGTDGIEDFDYADAGDAATATLLTCPCIDAARTPSADAFADAHRDRFDQVPGPMAAETFDVTTFVAEALRGLDGSEPVSKVRKHVLAFFDEATRLEGIAKTYSWNERGALTGRLDDVWVYEWSDDDISFVPVGSVEELVDDGA